MRSIAQGRARLTLNLDAVDGPDWRLPVANPGLSSPVTLFRSTGELPVWLALSSPGTGHCSVHTVCSLSRDRDELFHLPEEIERSGSRYGQKEWTWVWSLGQHDGEQILHKARPVWACCILKGTLSATDAWQDQTLTEHPRAEESRNHPNPNARAWKKQHADQSESFPFVFFGLSLSAQPLVLAVATPDSFLRV